MTDSGRTVFGGIAGIAASTSSVVYTLAPESPLLLSYGDGRNPIPSGGPSSAAPSVGYYLSTSGDMPAQSWVLQEANGEAFHDEGGGEWTYAEPGIFLSSLYFELQSAGSSAADPVRGGGDLTFEDYYDSFMASVSVATPAYVSVTWLSSHTAVPDEDWNAPPRLVRALTGVPMKIVSATFISAKIG